MLVETRVRGAAGALTVPELAQHTGEKCQNLDEAGPSGRGHGR